MRTGLGLGLGLGLLGGAAAHAVAIVTLPDILCVGETATIAGTTTAPDGTPVTIQVAGATFGTDTVSGGAWSVTAAPTVAGAGAVVTVACGATVATSATHVLPTTAGGVAAFFDARYGVSEATASVNPDVSSWNPTNLTLGGDASGYTMIADATGTERRYAGAFALTSVSNHPLTFKLKAKAGVVGWIHLFNVTAGIGAWVNMTNGAVGTTTACSASTSIDAGVVSIEMTSDTWDSSGTALYIRPCDADNDLDSTANLGDVCATIWDVEVSQVRASDITARYPVSSPPVAEQATAGKQPGYDGATLSCDGVDDGLVIAAGLGAQTSHHWFLVGLDTLSGATKNQALLDCQTGRLILAYSTADTLYWYDGAAHDTVSAVDLSADSIVELELDGVGGTGILRQNGASLPLADNAYAAKAANGNVGIGADTGTVGSISGLNWKAILVYPAELSGADAAIVRAILTDVFL